MEIIFAGDLRQALFRCADSSLLLRDTKHRRTISTPASNFLQQGFTVHTEVTNESSREIIGYSKS